MAADSTIIYLKKNGALEKIEFNGPKGKITKLPKDGCPTICDGHTKNPKPVQMEYHEGTCFFYNGKWYCYP